MEHTGKVEVAAVQWQHRQFADFDSFAEAVGGLLDQAADAQVVLFGEQFTVSLLALEHGWESMSSADFGLVGRHTVEYRQLFGREAVRRGQVILAGSHLVGSSASNQNVAHLFLPDGSVVTHAKTHIFPVEADSGTSEGEALSVVDLGFVTVGLEICYEAEIPEVTTVLARRGAELILCPSYTTTRAGFWRVRHCAHARAIENQVYFAHASTVGHLGGPIPDGFGKSSILSPCDSSFPADGVLAEARPDEEDVISATLDLDALHENRRTGAAPTYGDRLRRAAFYRRLGADLLPEGPPTASLAVGRDEH
jgi:predicted amidohydrolase